MVAASAAVVAPKPFVSARTHVFHEAAEKSELAAEAPDAPSLMVDGSLVPILAQLKDVYDEAMDEWKTEYFHDEAADEWKTEVAKYTHDEIAEWVNKRNLEDTPSGMTVALVVDTYGNTSTPARIVAGGRHQARCCPTHRRGTEPIDVGAPNSGDGSWQCGGCGSLESPDIWASWKLEGEDDAYPMPHFDEFIDAAMRQREVERESKTAQLACEASEALDGLEAYAAGDDSRDIYRDEFAWTDEYEPDKRWVSFVCLPGSDHEIGDEVVAEAYVIYEEEDGWRAWHNVANVTLQWNERMASLAND